MAPDNDVRLYRIPTPEVRKGENYSVIEDRGVLRAAVADSAGNFLFSEQGAGVKPLAIIGAASEIINFFIKKENRQIKNVIDDLPDIYLGVDYYIPKERYEGLFPVGDSITELVKRFSGFAPGDTLTDVAGGLKDIVDTGKDILAKKRSNKKFDPKILYVKISYLPEEGLTKVAERQIDFGRIAQILASSLTKTGIIEKKVPATSCA